jgi:hypothetical protein
MVGETNEPLIPGRVPHVRPSVHGTKKTGRSPFQRSFYDGKNAAGCKIFRAWSESI